MPASHFVLLPGGTEGSRPHNTSSLQQHKPVSTSRLKSASRGPGMPCKEPHHGGIPGHCSSRDITEPTAGNGRVPPLRLLPLLSAKSLGSSRMAASCPGHQNPTWCPSLGPLERGCHLYSLCITTAVALLGGMRWGPVLLGLRAPRTQCRVCRESPDP